MTRKYILQLLLPAFTTGILFSSSYKYEKDISYAAINGTVVDPVTKTTSIYAAYIQVAMTPAYVTNGALIVDSTGHFTNTRIIPGTYTFSGSGNDPYIYAFTMTTDSLTGVVLKAGQTTSVNLEVGLIPWVNVGVSVTAVTNSSITLSYSVKSNTSDLANEAAICWDTDSGKVNIKTEPLASGNYNANLNWTNFTEPSPPNSTPQAPLDGTYSYTITGLTPSTKYYICAMARVPNGMVDPKGNTANGNGDWWNASTIISATTAN